MTLPSGLQKVFMPLGILAFFAVSWFGLFKPEYEKISQYRAQPEASRSKIEAIVQRLSAFNPASEEERASWESIEKEINLRLPAGRQITDLNAFLSTMAEQNSLENFQRQEITGSDSSFTNGGVSRRGYVIELQFESTYSSLMEFIGSLKSSERLIEVVKLEITRNLPLVKAVVLVRSYYLPEEQK